MKFQVSRTFQGRGTACRALLVAAPLALSGCALLMPPNPYTKEVISALATDDASACVRVNLSGGGAGAAVGPGVIPAGGYGTVGFTLGRSGQDGMQVYVGADGSCQVRSKDKDFLTPSSPLQSLTMHGLGTGALAPTPGTAEEKPVDTDETRQQTGR